MGKENKVILSNIKDILFGMSISGIMAMLNGEDDSREAQIKAIEFFKKSSPKSPPLQEWCDYQLTVLHADDSYSIVLPDVENFVEEFAKLFLNRQENYGLIYLFSLASSHYEAGNVMSAKSPIYKTYIDDYCENILKRKIEDYSLFDQEDLFSLLTGAILQNSLLDVSANNEYEQLINEFVEYDRKIIDKKNG